jgi:hypothetical protein
MGCGHKKVGGIGRFPATTVAVQAITVTPKSLTPEIRREALFVGREPFPLVAQNDTSVGLRQSFAGRPQGTSSGTFCDGRDRSQPHLEGTALAHLAFHGQMTTVSLSDPFGDGKAQASAPPSAGLVSAVEALKDMGQVLRGNAHPRIADSYLHPPLLAVEGKPDSTASRGVLDSVVHQVKWISQPQRRSHSAMS